MAEGETATPDAPKRRSRALMLALPAALLLGGGSFYAVYSGLLTLPGADAEKEGAEQTAADGAPSAPEALEPAGSETAAMTPPSFVALDTLVIALGPGAGARHLKVSVQLETDPALRDSVSALKPRFADVLNTFLRAVDTSDIAAPHAMIRLRAQMLRRVRLVAPPGAVRDLLIEQFVLS